MPEGLLHPALLAPAAPGVRPLGAPLARLEGVGFRRGGEALLAGLDLTIPAGGGVTVLMGPNGAGKSLSLRLMAGLIAPCTGSVTRAAPEATALVFQKPVLLRRTVRANLRHALRLARVPRAERPARLEALLALGRLEALADRPARALSGGEQQRVALARALACRPRLLLLDEPTASLDPQATAAIEAIIARTVAGGTRAVLVTHDRGQAARLADRVAFLHAGRVVEEGPAETMLAAPRHAAARAYLDGRLLV